MHTAVVNKIIMLLVTLPFYRKKPLSIMNLKFLMIPVLHLKWVVLKFKDKIKLENRNKFMNTLLPSFNIWLFFCIHMTIVIIPNGLPVVNSKNLLIELTRMVTIWSLWKQLNHSVIARSYLKTICLRLPTNLLFSISVFEILLSLNMLFFSSLLFFKLTASNI